MGSQGISAPGGRSEQAASHRSTDRDCCLPNTSADPGQPPSCPRVIVPRPHVIRIRLVVEEVAQHPDPAEGVGDVLRGLSYLHNLCRFGETNEWSNEPPEPGWTSPLTVSGLTRVGRGERLLRAIAAPPSRILYPLVRGLPAISGGEPVDRQSACCHDGHAWRARGDGQLVARRCRNQERLPQRSLRLPSSPRAVAGANCVHDRPVATCPVNQFPGGQLAF